MNPGAEAQVLKDLNKAIENTGKGLKKTGEFIEDGVKKTGKAIEKGVKKTGDAISGDSDDTAATDSAEAEGGQVADGAVPTPQQKPVQKSYLFVQQAGSLKFANGKLTLESCRRPRSFSPTDRSARPGSCPTKRSRSCGATGQPTASRPIRPMRPSRSRVRIRRIPIVVELLSASLSGASLTYSVRTVSGEIPADAKDIALFVDLD